MPRVIKCFACGRILVLETAKGEKDKFGFGPYVDFKPTTEAIAIRLYHSQKDDRVGVVCPHCERVTYIKMENVEKIK